MIVAYSFCEVEIKVKQHICISVSSLLHSLNMIWFCFNSEQVKL